MSARAGERTTGSVNPIPPQPREIPGGLKSSLGSIWLWALVAAIIIVLLLQM